MIREFPDLPARMKRLPVSEKGFPIPYFAGEHNGKRDFRVITTEKMQQALDGDRCWICGERMGRFKAFVIGPMCGINRTISDPPSHRDCAIFAAKYCPFLSNPQAKRNMRDLPEDGQDAPGLGIKRNPGACAVWVTKSFKLFRAPCGGPGVLFEIGEPEEILWFCEGRAAARAEVQKSIDTGIHHLREACEMEDTYFRRLLAHAELDRRYQEFQKLLPAA